MKKFVLTGFVALATQMAYAQDAAPAEAATTPAPAAEPARNDMGMYVELNYSALTLKDGAYKIKPAMLRGIVGYNFNEMFAAEAMLGMGVKTDHTSNATATAPATIAAETKVKSMMGLFARVKYPLSAQMDVYARLGYVKPAYRVTSYNATGTLNVNNIKSDWNTAFGLGANYNMTQQMYLNADYLRINDDQDSHGLSLGVGYRF